MPCVCGTQCRICLPFSTKFFDFASRCPTALQSPALSIPVLRPFDFIENSCERNDPKTGGEPPLHELNGQGTLHDDRCSRPKCPKTISNQQVVFTSTIFSETIGEAVGFVCRLTKIPVYISSYNSRSCLVQTGSRTPLLQGGNTQIYLYKEVNWVTRHICPLSDFLTVG